VQRASGRNAPRDGTSPARSGVRDDTVRVLEHDPELGLGISPDRIAEAREALVAPSRTFAPGVWEVPTAAAPRARLGFLLLDGFVAREVTLAGTTCTELLGEGDILQPSPARRPDDSLLRHRVLWRVLEPARVAVLDDAFTRLLGRWPGVMAALLEREVRRTARMSLHQALLHLTPVETRLLLMFWHLAERWGRVTPAGITLRLRLSHQLLGQLVGCQRASVTTALRHIDESGLVVKRTNGTWLLRGSPPEELAQIHWQQPDAHGAPFAAGVRPAAAGTG
jgi:CRP/FNR family transcriptional regulator, cyclic AMP receptor protein